MIAWMNLWAIRAHAVQSGSAHVSRTQLVLALPGLLTMRLVRET
jgi:hypothetical protein